MDKGTGQVRVSRKVLLDPGVSVPDASLSASTPITVEPLLALPTFPVMPPRKWSRDFFRSVFFSRCVVDL